ncbi:IS256 family transposase, partial [Thiotrichales bacterium 19S3-7]|nr:IS256 family transposase [Thiotrichales bacterium 19S3-7]MCF6803131.1 IS256 family transposase [Thiotrichales bacterium 19S3-11]
MTDKKEKQDFDYISYEQQAIERLQNGQSLMGADGVLTPLIKRIVEASLETEMEAHLEQKTSINRRNGKSKKTVKSASGEFELETPRDRDGSFEPQLVKKRQTILNASLDEKVLALFALGMSYQDICAHLEDMYAVDISPALISKITDKLLPTITEWRNRPLESVYSIVYLDAMFFKARDNGRVVTKAVYNILGIDQNGHKDILGFYVAESEGAHFWLGVLNELKSRGVEDILIACIDGLKGFPEAISATFPKTEIQLCVIHQIRHSMKYVASKDQKPFMADLKRVYKAASLELAENSLLELDEKWGKKYSLVLKSWQDKWESLSAYFKYDPMIRRMIYTTNAVEGFHRQVRKYTKSKGAFTSESALVKLIYCAYQQIKKKWTMPLTNWAMTVSQLDIYFPG